jgi:hypothetical protein
MFAVFIVAVIALLTIAFAWILLVFSKNFAANNPNLFERVLMTLIPACAVVVVGCFVVALVGGSR